MSKKLEEKIKAIMRGEILSEDKTAGSIAKDEKSTSNAAAAQAKEEAAKNNKHAMSGEVEAGSGKADKAEVKEATTPGQSKDFVGDTTTGESGASKTAKTIAKLNTGAGSNTSGGTAGPESITSKVSADKQEDNGTNAKIQKGESQKEKGGKLSSPTHEAFDALFSGEELTEDFRVKAEALFEAALSEKSDELQEAYQSQLNEAIEEVKGELVEQIDGYLDYVVEQWMKDNAVALESGMKVEMVNSFIDGIKTVFQEHYVDVPEDKIDVVEEQAKEIAELQAEVAALAEQKEQAVGQATVLRCKQIVSSLEEGLTAIQTEKFHALTEDISFENEEEFAAKAKVIRESSFTVSNSQEVTPQAPATQLKESSSNVNAVVAALQKGNLKFARNV